jgi:hypothetical protein
MRKNRPALLFHERHFEDLIIVMIHKGQVRWFEKGDLIGQVRFIQRLLGIAALER